MTAAGGDYSQLATRGGVVAVHIQWICNLDWDFMKHCLPRLVLKMSSSSSSRSATTLDCSTLQAGISGT